ncbi:hypothetical protein GCM10010317_096660 [Streptomyces mirabilis]|uniref:tryptophan 7-halogenase n=1 Tax=Streptomyces mirabilis TaxID=68239 RepID=UPI001999138E|nr:tryptophan 7-halogenase [Streptomyces mirabilis]GHD78010.1 hypothetical protein GCM10010317_096660 [Streptomyces mirabilis]
MEPLESTGIYFVYAALFHLVKHFPDKRFDDVLVNRFNREVEVMFHDTRDFIQAHFSFAPRNDTTFWRACKELELAADFKEKVALYKSGLGVELPATDEANHYGNFEAEFRNFWSNANYYCVFAGLDVPPDHSMPMLSHRPSSIASAEEVFAEVCRRREELLKTLPTTYGYLRHIHGK